MKVKIKKCKHKRWWYKDMIGQADEKNEEYEFVLNDHVEFSNNELFVSERLLISSLVTKLSETKRFLLEQNAPMSKFYQYNNAKCN